mmetsp:Transcript_88719/g.249884  ORF Transcript_88719/g.249884 Transcript_88719/m.249884 type:complete len:232 (-) Transcript_88719:252-947(-)
MDGALIQLGVAIRDEFKQEVLALQKEFDHERQLRQLLEQQVLHLQRNIYSKAEVDQLMEGSQASLTQKTSQVKNESERDLRAAQRELEHRIEAALQNLQQTRPAELEKHKLAFDDLPLLSREIDRKLGSVLCDIDQKLVAAASATKKVAEEAEARATSHADQGIGQLSVMLSQAQTAWDADVQKIREDVSVQQKADGGLQARLASLQTELEQKIGMVQCNVDEVERKLCNG